jgi:hypothetical protein
MPFIVRSQDPPRADALNHTPIRYVNNVLSELMDGKAETIIGHIKEFSSLNLSKHRSVTNAFIHIIAAITAYQINPFKPKLNLQPRYRLETTA